ncbi:hypothetical protein CYMTET_41853 [Cymbomonas tetramitiformis]|uniref:Glycosyltransferase family 92 protein n=1 Tax=Cymbomonas tetramitiformis TaxID=36881 RepID=A0AAE0F1K4_9CHLO|nr:hypothetical protein CYMTET_41853 [Cymbomonas tetramitiformis]
MQGDGEASFPKRRESPTSTASRAGSARHPRTVPRNVGDIALPPRVLYIILSIPILLAVFTVVIQFCEEYRSNPFNGLNAYSIQPEEEHFSSRGGTQQVVLDYSQRQPVTPLENSWPEAGGRPAVGAGANSSQKPKLAIATTTGDGLNVILPWLAYHRMIGIERFFLFVERFAASDEVAAVLRRQPGVMVFTPGDDLDTRRSNSRIWNETWLSSFFNRPCNYALFVRQNLNLEISIAESRKAGMNWIMHVDTDELLYPGGTKQYSLQELFGGISSQVDTVVFPNYEALAEVGDATDPFIEVTLFKRNFDHVVKETYFQNYRDVTRGNPNYFLTYGNGKSAARISDGLRPNGAHRFHSYVAAPREMKMSEAAVLHYTYNRFSDVVDRKHRCDCKPTDNELKKCFILEFDREAAKAATNIVDDAELHKWYEDRAVWLDKAMVTRFLANGLFTRIYTPQVVMAALKSSGSALSHKSDHLRSTPSHAQQRPISIVLDNKTRVAQNITRDRHEITS